MTRKEFRNLKKGDLVIFDGTRKKHKNGGCGGLILEVDELIMEKTNIPIVRKNEKGEYVKTGEFSVEIKVKLKQPFIESDFELITKGISNLQLVTDITRK